VFILSKLSINETVEEVQVSWGV